MSHLLKHKLKQITSGFLKQGAAAHVCVRLLLSSGAARLLAPDGALHKGLWCLLSASDKVLACTQMLSHVSSEEVQAQSPIHGYQSDGVLEPEAGRLLKSFLRS